ERGPPVSPQTNGVAERFNQTLLTKIRCLLAQSKIPVQLWNETAKHGSLLLNLLPHKAINMESPLKVLQRTNATIESEMELNELIPFGIKTTVHVRKNDSKLDPSGETLKALTYKEYPDGMRFYNDQTKRVSVSRDYIVPNSSYKNKLRQDIITLPIPVVKTRIESGINVEAPRDEENTMTEHSPILPVAHSKNKHYAYVPHYDEAQKNISAKISTQNIMKDARKRVNRSDRFMLADVIPFSKAVNDPTESIKWEEEMKVEYESLMNHNTGELVPYPSHSKVIGGMWRLTKKKNEFGDVYRYKARWVVLGNHQEHLLHYFDTWASVGRNESFKTMISLVVNLKYIPYQFNTETAFLHGEMDTTVYVKQVKGFEVKGKEGWVWKLNKSLYGTKQAPRMWQLKLIDILTRCGMLKSTSDDSLFLNNNKSLILHVHVDDGFIIGKSEDDIVKFLSSLSKELTVKYRKQPTQHLGYRLDWQAKNSVGLSQADLIKKLLHDNDMTDSKGVKTPCNGNLLIEIDDEGEVVVLNSYQRAIGSLNYLAQHTRPDIMFMVNQLSRFSTKPTTKHWTALKHLLRYLNGTLYYQLIFTKLEVDKPSVLEGWADSDYANDRKDRKSISGLIVTVYGNPIFWLSKKQTVVAQSTTEAEFIAMNICSKQLRWLSFLLNDMGISFSKPVLNNDNSGATTISKQAALNDKTKHIE
ncbi:hypothetical protein O181_103503, partial [Austropuccinia psidii MF-1]|nr:hypothetical protein [Austropuccinia psidii MF-1]